MKLSGHFAQQKLLAVFTCLAIMLSSSNAFASRAEKRLNILLAGGRSYPLSQFADIAKIGSNWAGGAELRFRSNWAIGIVLHRAEFEHLRVWYDFWHNAWTYTDWTFIRGNWYAKYTLRGKGISPFLKFGLGIYFMESKRTLVRGPQSKGQTTGYSVVPGAALEYATKIFMFFIQTDYNIVLRKSIGGCTASNRLSQFFDLFLGVGFFISDL